MQKNIGSSLSQQGKIALLILLALAVSSNLWLLYLYYEPTPKRLFGDENYYFFVAEKIAAGHQVKHNPIWPAFYANSMGKLFSVFGTSRVCIQSIQIVMWLTTALLFYKIVSHLFPYRIVAYFAVALFLFSPELMAFSHFFWPEIPHLFFFMAALWLIICHCESYRAVVFGGVLFGFALLTKLLLQPFVPVILAFFILRTPGNAKQKCLKGCLLVSMIFFTILPTMIANCRTHGKFMIADSSVFNIWVGLNDAELVDYKNDIAGRESYEFHRSGPDIKARNSIYRDKIRRRLQQQGIIYTIKNQLSKQYFRLFDYETFFTTQLPGGPRDSYNFDNPGITNLLHAYSHVLYGFLLATSAIGICFIRWRSVGWAHCFVLFIAYNLVLLLFLHIKTRYVIQFVPMMMFFSAVTVYWLSLLVRRKPFLPVSCFVFGKYRIILGILFAVLIEMVAFRSFFVAN